MVKHSTPHMNSVQHLTVTEIISYNVLTTFDITNPIVVGWQSQTPVHKPEILECVVCQYSRGLWSHLSK